jgi:hypothetical protein
MKTILYGIGIFVGFCFLMSFFEKPAVTAVNKVLTTCTQTDV